MRNLPVGECTEPLELYDEHARQPAEQDGPLRLGQVLTVVTEVLVVVGKPLHTGELRQGPAQRQVPRIHVYQG